MISVIRLKTAVKLHKPWNLGSSKQVNAILNMIEGI